MKDLKQNSLCSFASDRHEAKSPSEINRKGFSASVAETEGFEPSIRLPVYKLSRLARSTTLTGLQYPGRIAKIMIFYKVQPFPNTFTAFYGSINQIIRVWPHLFAFSQKKSSSITCFLFNQRPVSGNII